MTSRGPGQRRPRGRPALRGWKRVTLLVLSLAALAAGTGLLLGGLAVIATFGTDGVATSEPGRAFTPGAAVVADPEALHHGPGDLDLYELVVAARSERGGRVFVGLGATADVERWLAGVPRAEVLSIRTEPLRLVTDEVPGTAVPARPEAQPFWLESDVGIGERTIRWDPSPGDWRLVVAMDDGASPLELRMRVDLESPFAFWVGVALTVAGGLLVLVGVLLLVAGLRGRRKPELPPGVPGGYPEGYEPGRGASRKPPTPAPPAPSPQKPWPPVPAPQPLPWENGVSKRDYGR